MKILGIVCGVLSLLYCMAIFISGSFGTSFFLIWLVIGLFFLSCAVWGKKILGIFPTRLKRFIYAIMSFGIALFIFVESMVLSGFFEKEEPKLDMLVVLGAQLRENGPSYVLKVRLDRAYEYLLEYPDTKVIVSGGRGVNEPDTEARGMYDYLVKKGISADRIIMEDKSRNTNENIKYSKAYLDASEDKIGIVTNNFHMFRAVHIARAAGYQQVYGLPAKSDILFLPNNMLREFFGIIKDFMVGNLG